MWESRLFLGEISKGLVESVGSLHLAFHTFHSPAISTALFELGERRQMKRGGKGDSILHDRSSVLLAVPIFVAHSVSLMRPAIWANCANPTPGFKYCSACDRDFSFP